ncbi:hypothetical protein TURU_084665 [Turdus rufiventris]|nr:hypothetical protein TURU_084665 [Turdus rufiventris]
MDQKWGFESWKGEFGNKKGEFELKKGNLGPNQRFLIIFVLRISDSHKKVKQMALDVLAEIIAILKDAMNQEIIHLFKGITRNLNSKDPRVHAAAVNALEESMAHLGLARFFSSKSFRPSSSMLLPSKPLPSIQKSSPFSNTIKICSVEQENGKNGTGCDDSRNEQELCSEGKVCEASLLDSTEGDMKKGSLGLPLILPIHKAVSPPLGSAAGSLLSSVQLDVQESQEMSTMSNHTPYAPRAEVVVGKKRQGLEAPQDFPVLGLALDSLCNVCGVIWNLYCMGLDPADL